MNNRQRKKLQAKMKFNLPNVPHFTAVERWNLYHTFSVYIAAGLRIFLSYEIFGVPTEIAEKYDKEEPVKNFKPDKKFFDDLQDEVEKYIAEKNKVPAFDSRKELTPAEKEWRGILNKMLWSFEEIRDNYPNSPYGKWHMRQIFSLLKNRKMPIEFGEADELGLCEVKLNGDEPPQEILDAEEKYREKIQEGLELFTKHFFSLWD